MCHSFFKFSTTFYTMLFLFRYQYFTSIYTFLCPFGTCSSQCGHIIIAIYSPHYAHKIANFFGCLQMHYKICIEFYGRIKSDILSKANLHRIPFSAWIYSACLFRNILSISYTPIKLYLLTYIVYIFLRLKYFTASGDIIG